MDAWDCLQAIFLPLNEDDATGVRLALPIREVDRRHDWLEFKTDGGRLIGLRVGIDADIWGSRSDYLLVIDRPGLLKFLAGARLSEPRKRHFVPKWTLWGSGITTFVPTTHKQRV